MSASLKILHVLRAPVGGLFRHVADLARTQAARGHQVGVICCAEAADRLTEERLQALSSHLSLGLFRIPMAREIDLRDFTATRATRKLAARLGVEVLHGHGAKGGAYARLAAARLKRRSPGSIKAVYTPHGGSLHYAPGSLKGRIFMGLERRFARSTDGIIFESAYSSLVYAQNVAPRTALNTRVIPNGVGPDEFAPVPPNADATDFVFVGELRHLKGVDVMLDALAGLRQSHNPTAVIVGDGPDATAFRSRSETLGLTSHVRFPGAMPARDAFALGRSLVMPSRAESFPYVVLEAGAAALPMIATSVGGIPEIIAGSTVKLVAAEDADALAAAMRRHLEDRQAVTADALSLQNVIAQRFTIAAMADQVLAFYDELMSG